MANPRQRRKQRSTKSKLTRRTGDRLKKVNIVGSEVIARHWDKTKTLKQNYEALGLVADPNHKPAASDARGTANADDGEGPEEADDLGLKTNEAIIRRDEDGNVIEIVYSKLDAAAQTGADSDDDEDDNANGAASKQLLSTSAAIRELEAKAAADAGAKRVREASAGEVDWLRRLVSKYGDDFQRAARDRRVNPMQQTAADIRARAAKVRRQLGDEAL